MNKRRFCAASISILVLLPAYFLWLHRDDLGGLARGEYRFKGHSTTYWISRIEAHGCSVEDSHALKGGTVVVHQDSWLVSWFLVGRDPKETPQILVDCEPDARNVLGEILYREELSVAVRCTAARALIRCGELGSQDTLYDDANSLLRTEQELPLLLRRLSSDPACVPEVRSKLLRLLENKKGTAQHDEAIKTIKNIEEYHSIHILPEEP